MTYLLLVLIYLNCGLQTTYLSRLGRGYPRAVWAPFTSCFCDHCGAKIPALYTFPLLGWLLAGGQSKCCSKPIPLRFPFMELLGIAGGFSLLLALSFNALIAYLAVLGFTSALLLAFAVGCYGAKIKLANLALATLSNVLTLAPILLL